MAHKMAHREIAEMITEMDLSNTIIVTLSRQLKNMMSSKIKQLNLPGRQARRGGQAGKSQLNN